MVEVRFATRAPMILLEIIVEILPQLGLETPPAGLRATYMG
jgi:hypothetical protein